MSKENYLRHNCPVSQSLGTLGGQWTLLIARDLMNGLNSFDKIQKNLNISRNLLAKRLKQMEQDKLAKKIIPQGTKRSIYVPTKKCMDLTNILLALSEWSEKWMPDPSGPRIKVCNCKNGKNLKLALLSEKQANKALETEFEVRYLTTSK